MNGSEIERLATLEAQVRGMRDDLSELKGTVVGADFYKSAHGALERRVQSLERDVRGRPSWFVATVIGILTTTNAALLSGLVWTFFK